MAYAQILSLNSKYRFSELIRVEVDTARGFHSFNIVGMAHKSVSEARDRVASAVKNCGYISPKQINQKIVVSLAPAHIIKEGTHFDLAIALGYLVAIKEIPPSKLTNVIFVGELGLNGEIRPIKHALSVIRYAASNNLTAVIPRANAVKFGNLSTANILLADHLKEIINWSKGKFTLKKLANESDDIIGDMLTNSPSYGKSDNTQLTSVTNVTNDPPTIIGNAKGKLAIALSVIGNHHVFLYGPAGSGKTSLVNWLHLLMPPLCREEQLEVSEIRGHFIEENTDGIFRPFRAPQHNITLSKFIGGGNPVRAGEITLAHNGVLFMDEFIEFDHNVVNSLREPIQNKFVTIHTGSRAVNLPANFTLICATNLCNCGNYGSKHRKCHCGERLKAKYLDRLPGPIIDRIPIWSLVDDEVDDKKNGMDFPGMKNLIEKSLEFRRSRIVNTKNSSTKYGRTDSTYHNLDDRTKNLFEMKCEELGLSRRQMANYANLARTIADMNGEATVNLDHIAKALEYIPDYNVIRKDC